MMFVGKKMTRIAIIGIRGLPGLQGGVEKHCENLYPRFDSNVEIRVYRRKPYLTTLSDKQYQNIKYVDMPSTRIKGLEAVLHTFLCCLHILFHRVDIVHIHNIGPGMFTPLIRLMGIKVVLTYHSPNYEHDKWGTISKAILRFSEFLSLNFANKIIFVNKFQMEKYSATVRDKSLYIPNGINDVSRSDSTTFIDKVGAKKGKYILGVGRLTPEKGFEYLIKAVNKSTDVEQLVIAGASDHDSHYFESLKALDVNHKVIFTGFTSGEDLRQLYSHARMFVLSSVNEGFPLVMLEAMSYNLQMVVSDIPATHLISLPKERYAQNRDADNYASKISEFYDCNSYCDYNLSSYKWDSIAKITQKAIVEA